MTSSSSDFDWLNPEFNGYNNNSKSNVNENMFDPCTNNSNSISFTTGFELSSYDHMVEEFIIGDFDELRHSTNEDIYSDDMSSPIITGTSTGVTGLEIFTDFDNEFIFQDSIQNTTPINHQSQSISTSESESFVPTVAHPRVVKVKEESRSNNISNVNTTTGIKNKVSKSKASKSSGTGTWSVKNRMQGKTWGEYMKRQHKIARRLGNQLITVFNNQDLIATLDFIDTYYSEEIEYHEIVKGIHPLTGEVDSNTVVKGIDAIKGVTKLCMTISPDSLVIVDSLDIINNGKNILLYVTQVVTSIIILSGQDWKNGKCDYDFNSISSKARSKETHVTSGIIEIHLNNHNKILKITNKSVHEVSNVF